MMLELFCIIPTSFKSERRRADFSYSRIFEVCIGTCSKFIANWQYRFLPVSDDLYSWIYRTFWLQKFCKRWNMFECSLVQTSNPVTLIRHFHENYESENWKICDILSRLYYWSILIRDHQAQFLRLVAKFNINGFA